MTARSQLSVSGPLDADEMAKLLACLHDEMTLDNGADPSVHGLYDYYETTKRLVDTVTDREAVAWLITAERDRLRETFAKFICCGCVGEGVDEECPNESLSCESARRVLAGGEW